MILISYDGSTDADTAIDLAALLLPGTETVVLTIWEPLLDMMMRAGSMGLSFGMAGGWTDDAEADAAVEQRAIETAARGAERAAAAGLSAQSRIATRVDGIAKTVLGVAEELDAQLIVLGTRGLSGIKSMMLGSVSADVVHHADRAVLIVPSATVAAERRDWAKLADVAARSTV